MAVHRTVKRYEELGIAKDGPRSGRRRSMNMSSKRILRDNKRPMRKMTSDLNISPASIRRMIKHELRF
uniref:Helix-turn-helix domain-containing protein n=1 Tax=Heterorhabditis bacteriophora TaxID=37862 RepID=A0A1I7X8V0_HETBA